MVTDIVSLPERRWSWLPTKYGESLSGDLSSGADWSMVVDVGCVLGLLIDVGFANGASSIDTDVKSGAEEKRISKF
jgi:hypothetical protein